MKNFILVSFVAISIVALSACDSGFDSKALNPVSQTVDTPTPTPTPTPDPGIPPGTPCGEAQLKWTNPTTYTDGTAITQPLSRNILFFGFGPTQFSNSVNITNPPANGAYRVTGLQFGRTYYFAVKAVDFASIESAYSGVVSKVINTCPTLSIAETLNEIIIDGGGDPHAEAGNTSLGEGDAQLGSPALN
jgi:hypothetical protein